MGLFSLIEYTGYPYGKSWFTLTQDAKDAENTERAEIYGIAYVINVFFIYLYGQSMIMLYEGHR